jgi:prevent-host-death family protein
LTSLGSGIVADFEIGFPGRAIMAIIAMRHRRRVLMRSVNVAELKNRLSKYLRFARGGEEIVIRDRNLPVAKLVPFSADDSGDQELMLVAAGKMRLPKTRLDVKKLLKIPTGSVASREAIQAILDDREEGL